MNYRETLEVLYAMMPDFQQVGGAAYKPGMERVAEFLEVLGNPHERFRAIHVAGTNGKGSVSHMLAAALRAGGERVGLYTSPHLRDFRERMRIDGAMIDEREVAAFAEHHLETMRELRLSFFEATMCMAFDWFARREVDVAVVEAGLGGRLDSTNILTPTVSVITNIGLDHQQFLGATLAEIAGEKAGIVKRGGPVVVGERGVETDGIFLDKAAEMSASLTFAEDVFRAVRLGREGRVQRFEVEDRRTGVHFCLDCDLLGDYQTKNIVTLLAALDVLRVAPHGLGTAALDTGLRGRWEVLGSGPLVVADTGHNAHGLRQVAAQLRGERYEKLYFVLGVAADKDLDAILPLLPDDARYLFTAPSTPRALPPEKLAARAAAHGLRGEIVSTVAQALARARALATPNDMIFIGGSNFTVAEII